MNLLITQNFQTESFISCHCKGCPFSRHKRNSSQNIWREVSSYIWRSSSYCSFCSAIAMIIVSNMSLIEASRRQKFSFSWYFKQKTLVSLQEAQPWAWLLSVWRKLGKKMTSCRCLNSELLKSIWRRETVYFDLTHHATLEMQLNCQTFTDSILCHSEQCFEFQTHDLFHRQK